MKTELRRRIDREVGFRVETFAQRLDPQTHLPLVHALLREEWEANRQALRNEDTYHPGERWGRLREVLRDLVARAPLADGLIPLLDCLIWRDSPPALRLRNDWADAPLYRLLTPRLLQADAGQRAPFAPWHGEFLQRLAVGTDANGDEDLQVAALLTFADAVDGIDDTLALHLDVLARTAPSPRVTAAATACLRRRKPA